jgi:Nif-specific regulatory protein
MLHWNDRAHMPFKTERHERELDALMAVSRILSSGQRQQQMLLKVLEVLERELTMIRGTVMLLSLDGRELTVEAAPELRPDAPAARYRSGEGIIGRVLQTGRPAVVPNIAEEPDFQDRIYRRRERGGENLSFICVPIALQNEVVGTLSVDLPSRGADALHESERVLLIVASMIANDVHARRNLAAERQGLEAENMHLRNVLGERFRPDTLVGNSSAMQHVYQRLHQVRESDTTVLIRGESGTGKELVASAIHFGSKRAEGPFVRVNCAALGEGFMECELFGQEKGAVVDAMHQRRGRIEEASGGTLFLDEIGEFSPALQVKLLRVLQEREYQRVGSDISLKADVRILAATSRDLEQAVDAGTFRKDLYYRVNIVPIFLPPLRERRDDIMLLADHFVDKYSRKMGKKVQRISTTAINALMAYHWPGNVRELENCIEHAVLLASDGVVQGHSLPPSLQMPSPEDAPDQRSLKARVLLLERDVLTDALKRYRGNVSAAARELGITSRMVRYKIQSLNIEDLSQFRMR